MAESFGLKVEKRTKFGTAEARRLRKKGLVPGNVYGHEMEPMAVATSSEAVNSAVYGGHKVVDLEVDGATEKAMFQDVQWNTFSTEILHFDLLRVDANERVTIDVSLELKGISPGVVAGGVLTHPTREITIECLVFDIPESIPVRIGHLELDTAITVADLQIPDGVKVHTDPETLIVQVTTPEEVTDADDELADAGPAQPEVIGKKDDSDEEEGNS